VVSAASVEARGRTRRHTGIRAYMTDIDQKLLCVFREGGVSGTNRRRSGCPCDRWV